MALDDFWEIKDNQVYLGKPVLNVYHAKRVEAGATAADVGQAFLDSIVNGTLDALQPEDLLRTTVEVANLEDATDFSSQDSSAFPGVIIANDLPTFNAATIQFNRTRTDMKNGRKGFLAGTELEQDAGEWNAGFITLLNGLADAILAPWVENAAPGVDVCVFVILKRFCIVPAQDPCQAYRLPSNDVEADDNHYVPTSALVRKQVRSQVSRKILT